MTNNTNNTSTRRPKYTKRRADKDIPTSQNVWRSGMSILMMLTFIGISVSIWGFSRYGSYVGYSTMFNQGLSMTNTAVWTLTILDIVGSYVGLILFNVTWSSNQSFRAKWPAYLFAIGLFVICTAADFSATSRFAETIINGSVGSVGRWIMVYGMPAIAVFIEEVILISIIALANISGRFLVEELGVKNVPVWIIPREFIKAT